MVGRPMISISQVAHRNLDSVAVFVVIAE